MTMTKEEPSEKLKDLANLRRSLKNCSSSVRFTVDAFLAEHYNGMYVPVEVENNEYLGTCHCLKGGVANDVERAHATSQYLVSVQKFVKDRRSNTVETRSPGSEPSFPSTDKEEIAVPLSGEVSCVGGIATPTE